MLAFGGIDRIIFDLEWEIHDAGRSLGLSTNTMVWAIRAGEVLVLLLILGGGVWVVIRTIRMIQQRGLSAALRLMRDFGLSLGLLVVAICLCMGGPAWLDVFSTNVRIAIGVTSFLVGLATLAVFARLMDRLLERTTTPFKVHKQDRGKSVFLPGWGDEEDHAMIVLEKQLKGHGNPDVTVERREIVEGSRARTYLTARLGRASAFVRAGALGEDLSLESCTYLRGRTGVLSCLAVFIEIMLFPFAMLARSRLSDLLRRTPDEFGRQDGKMLSGWIRQCLGTTADKIRKLPQPARARPDLGGAYDPNAEYPAEGADAVREMPAARVLELVASAAWVVGLMALVSWCLGWGLLSHLHHGRDNYLVTGLASLLGYASPMRTSLLITIAASLPLAFLATCFAGWLATRVGQWVPSLNLPPDRVFLLATGVSAVALGIFWPMIFNLILAAAHGYTMSPSAILTKIVSLLLLIGGLTAARWLRRKTPQGQDNAPGVAERTDPSPAAPGEVALWASRLRRAARLLRGYLLGLAAIVAAAYVLTHFGSIYVHIPLLIVVLGVLSFLTSRFLLSKCIPGRRLGQEPALLLEDAAGKEEALMEAIEGDFAERQMPYKVDVVSLRHGLRKRSFLRVRMGAVLLHIRASVLGKDLTLYWVCNHVSRSLLARLLGATMDRLEAEDVKELRKVLENIATKAMDRLGLARQQLPGSLEGKAFGLPGLGFKKV